MLISINKAKSLLILISGLGGLGLQGVTEPPKSDIITNEIVELIPQKLFSLLFSCFEKTEYTWLGSVSTIPPEMRAFYQSIAKYNTQEPTVARFNQGTGSGIIELNDLKIHITWYKNKPAETDPPVSNIRDTVTKLEFIFRQGTKELKITVLDSTRTFSFQDTSSTKSSKEVLTIHSTTQIFNALLDNYGL